MGGSGWYIRHKREVPPEKSSGPTPAEKQVAVAKPAKDRTDKRRPKRIAAQTAHP